MLGAPTGKESRERILKVAQMLIDKKCDVGIRAKHGDTAMSFAKRLRNEKLLKKLKVN